MPVGKLPIHNLESGECHFHHSKIKTKREKLEAIQGLDSEDKQVEGLTRWVGLGCSSSFLLKHVSRGLSAVPSHARARWALGTLLRVPDLNTHTASPHVRGLCRCYIRRVVPQRTHRCPLGVPLICPQPLALNGRVYCSDENPTQERRRSESSQVWSGILHKIDRCVCLSFLFISGGFLATSHTGVDSALLSVAGFHCGLVLGHTDGEHCLDFFSSSASTFVPSFYVIKAVDPFSSFSEKKNTRMPKTTMEQPAATVVWGLGQEGEGSRGKHEGRDGQLEPCEELVTQRSFLDVRRKDEVPYF